MIQVLLKNTIAELRRVYMFSDNASVSGQFYLHIKSRFLNPKKFLFQTYHSVETLSAAPAIAARENIELKSWIFSGLGFNSVVIELLYLIIFRHVQTTKIVFY